MEITEKKFGLTIETGDLASEIFILDSQFHKIEKGVGNKSTFQLEQGLYIAKVNTSNQSIEKSIVLTANTTINFDPIPLDSPIPFYEIQRMAELDSNGEYIHIETKPDFNFGTGSRLCVFTKNEFSSINELDIGFTLRNIRNEILLNFEYPFYGCDTEMDPGIYILCVENDEGDLFKSTIITSPGWQTNAFLKLKKFGIKRKIIIPDLINYSVLMMRNDGRNYSYNNSGFSDDRLTEQIRQGLSKGRNVLSFEVLDKLLNEKFENPMLGIYAAHILLLDEKENFSIVSTIVENLRKMLGYHHPDVEAIAIKVGKESNFRFEFFPMLAKSWYFVLEEYKVNQEIIPINSLAYENSGNFWNTDLWLIWGNEDIKERKNNTIKLIKEIVPYLLPILSENSKIDIMDILNIQIIKEKLIKKNLHRLPKAKKLLDSIFNKVELSKVEEISKLIGIPPNKLENILIQINIDKIKEELKNFNTQSTSEFNNDPQKGKWGGKTRDKFREISAIVKESKIKGLFRVKVIVESTNEDKPLSGKVRFYLHDTFLNPEPVVDVIMGKAVLDLNGVWGSFTIGAVIENEKTELELDLSELNDVPVGFKGK